jgi:AcrR family transcriptional regulator
VTAAVPPTPRRPYHHGDLKAALVDGAIALIAERGVQRFSLAELSRRIGVAPAAPYRHFADREALLAAVAVRALDAFGQVISAGSANDPPEQRLAAMAAAYVRFAAEQRALFSVVFGFGLDKKGRYPDLRRAYEQVEGVLDECVNALCADTEEAAALADAVEATAHGYAMLLTDGPDPPEPAAVDRAAEGAAGATLALVGGRASLRGGRTPR